ncbi:MAG TPA: hypothetical protein VJZ27_05080, partial [Aggregatilineales bacterium]|nr:hypothetical protein [Aggregatilineales bacterium]
ADVGFNTRYAEEAPHMAEWIGFLETFYGTATETASTSTGRVTIQNVVSAGDVTNTLYPPTLVFETEGKDITGMSFSAILKLEDGIQFMIDQASLVSLTFTEEGDPIVDIPDGVSSSQYTWTVDMPVITDGNASVPTVLLETGEDESVVVTGLYGFPNGETLDAYLVFDVETQKVVKVLGINESENGGQPFDITVTAGDEFLPTWRFFDENGDLQLIPAESTLTFGSEPFSYDFVPASSGIYDIVIRIEDVAGNVYADVVEIPVDNEGVDTSYRGENDVNFGYSVIYPWAWTGSVDIEAEDGTTRSVYTDNDGVVTVYFNFYEATELADMESIAVEYLDGFATAYSEGTAIAVGGYDAVEYQYEAENDEGTPTFGYVVYTVVPENETGYLIDYEVTGEGTEESESYYPVLIANISFFPPLEDDTEGGDASGEVGSVEALITSYGLTVDDINAALEADGLTVDDLQAMVDNGEITLEDLEILLFSEE